MMTTFDDLTEAISANRFLEAKNPYIVPVNWEEIKAVGRPEAILKVFRKIFKGSDIVEINCAEHMFLGEFYHVFWVGKTPDRWEVEQAFESYLDRLTDGEEVNDDGDHLTCTELRERWMRRALRGIGAGKTLIFSLDWVSFYDGTPVWDFPSNAMMREWALLVDGMDHKPLDKSDVVVYPLS